MTAFSALLATVVLCLCVSVSKAFNVNDYTPSDYVSCTTTQGDILISLYSDWAPNGVARFLHLVNEGFYTNIAFYRTVAGFLTQFGIAEDENLLYEHTVTIEDDPSVGIPFNSYFLSFAGGGNHTRTTQLFFTLASLSFLGEEPWEVPIGQATASKSVLKNLYYGYGDWAPYGNGPSQLLCYEQGLEYLQENFPLLDYILSCQVVAAPPTKAPVANPTKKPTVHPTETPTADPTISLRPTDQPTEGPTEAQTEAGTEASTTA